MLGIRAYPLKGEVPKGTSMPGLCGGCLGASQAQGWQGKLGRAALL